MKISKMSNENGGNIQETFNIKGGERICNNVI